MVGANDSQEQTHGPPDLDRRSSRVITEPRPTTRTKILDALDEQSIDFLKRCPFALVGTAAADGTIESRPRVTSRASSGSRIQDPADPERIGNNLAFGLSNILATARSA